jgi:prepilin-type N-terminal cleavage/methylation domain-containing protein
MRGYSLIEMIVSVGIFSVVMLVSTSAYLSLISLDRQARATSDVMSNLTFVVDSMSRNIRTGRSYCISGCTSNSFSFVNAEGETVVYAYTNGTITQKIGTANPESLIDPRITIDATYGLRFYTWGTTAGSSDGQPRVTFTVAGSMTPDPRTPAVTFAVQGTATQRLIDL